MTLAKRAIEAHQPINVWQRIKEVDMFFQQRDQVHKSLRRVVKKLEKAGIAYALVGGMAVKTHGHERTTKDVDLLLTPEGLSEFCLRFVPKDYEPVAGRPRRFVDRKNQVTLDILVSGLFPGRGTPGPIAFPDPAAVSENIQDLRVVNLPTLIQLKLAARRHQDFADVVNLIVVHHLDESYLGRLHSSVHQDFIECLEERCREEEYLKRNG